MADIVLGRPKISLEWRTQSFDRPALVELPIRTKKQSVHLQIKVSKSTGLMRYLAWRSHRGQFVIQIRVPQEGVVKLTPQTGPDCFKRGQDRQTLIFDKVIIRGGRTVVFADFTVTRLGSENYLKEVDVAVKASWIPRICRTPVTLAKIESGIERFVLEGGGNGAAD